MMPENLHFNQTDHLAHERVSDLRATADELHNVRRLAPEQQHTGLVPRARATIGRRLISLGSAVAGQHA